MTPDSNELLARVEAMRMAIEPFIRHYDPSWMDDWADDKQCTVFSRVTFGDLRRARSAFLSAPVPSPDGAAKDRTYELKGQKVTLSTAIDLGLAAILEAAPSPSDDVRSALADELENLHRIGARSGVAFKCADNIDKIIAALRSAPVSGPACCKGLAPAEYCRCQQEASTVPAVGVTREAIAKVLFARRHRIYADDLDTIFEQYANAPKGTDRIRLAVFSAFSDADAILALSPVPASPQHVDREATVSARDAVIEECAKVSDGVAKAYCFSTGDATHMSLAVDKVTLAIRSLASGAKS